MSFRSGPPTWCVAVVAIVAAAACCAQQQEPPREGTSVALASNGGHVETPAQRESARVARSRTAHVIIVSMDGLRPDAIARYEATTLMRLMREGRYALRARTIVPSTTIPSHASMLTGVGLPAHRVIWNDDDDKNAPIAVPSVFTYVKREGLSTAAFFSKSKFGQLFPRGSLDTTGVPTRSDGLWPAHVTVANAAAYLSTSSPALLFVHLAETDYAGHLHGWMTEEYGVAVRSSDVAVARLLAAADSTFGAAGYTVIVTGDHGGHSQTHGTPRSDDMRIPWIVWGKGVQPGAPLRESIRTMDTAATALWLLGIDVPREWAGHAVPSAFVAR